MKITGLGGRLFRKYVVVLLVLVGGVLMASSLVELYFSYRETQLAIVRVERQKAVAAAVGIEQFLREVEQQVRETTRTASDDPDASQVGQGKLGFRQGLGAALAEQRELDFLRVLRNVPAVSELTHLDLAGKEQLRVSRLEPDVVGSQADFSKAPKFLEARAGKTYWSPVYFKNDSEPYVTLAVPLGKYALEVTTAEVSLGAVLKAVSQIDVGKDGYAYVVDSRNQLVAHPDSRLLREKRDVAALTQVKAARAGRSGPTEDAPVAMVADGLGGGRVLAAHAEIPPLRWLVFVERPAADAYAPLRAPIIRSAVIFVLGLGLSMLASLFLARRMVRPIRVLQEGAERIGAGRLDQPIELHTGDEIEALAVSFNRMTASLKESYEGLEQKVEARTRELADANRDLTETLEQQTATSEILRVISSSPTDIEPVLDALVKSATRFCGAYDAVIFLREGESLKVAAHHGPIPQPAGRSVPLVRGTVGGRALLDRRAVHVADLQAEVQEFPEGSAFARQLGHRTILSVPLVRERTGIGVIQLRRAEVNPFSDKQIALLQTFADQAVIAIENVRLFKELEVRNRDLTESLQQQTATSEILRVISQSPTDLQPVLDTVAANAARLCDSVDAQIFQIDGHALRPAAWFGSLPKTAAEETRPVSQGSVNGRAVVERRTIHIHDLAAESETEWPEATAFQKRFGHRSIVATPLLREGTPIGAITIRRMEVRPFSDQQIKLLETFADQAVIAIENVRLFKELEARNRDLTEALEQQTATSEILRVISSSPTDIEPVLDALVKSATRFCGAYDAVIFLPEGDSLRVGAHHGPILNPVGLLVPLVHGTVAGRALLERQAVHVADLQAEAQEFPEGSSLARQLGHRTTLSVPLMRESAAIGVIQLRRNEVNPFSDKQMALLQTFADQAVIAIENVRLFKELEARNRDLSESLDQQTATSEILRVISSSPTDVQPVFDTIVQSARRLCGSDSAGVLTYDGELIHIQSLDNDEPERADALRQTYPRPANREHATGRAILTGRPVQIADVREDREYALSLVRDAGIRSVLAVPMIRDGIPIGAIAVQRWVTPRPFSDEQIALLSTFADQAVIAVENVRLFKELEARNAELTETLARQTATGEVLRAISRAQTDAQPVFDIIAASALRLCNAGHSGLTLYDGELIHLAAQNTIHPEGAEAIRRAYPLRPGGETAVSRAIRTRLVVHIPDVLEDQAYELKSQAEAAGFRSYLAAPMLRDGEPIGTIGVGRAQPGPFSDKQIELLQTFADQAVIAIENVRLFTELEARNRDLTESLEQQTATTEILGVISGSPTDVQPVFDAIVQSGTRLCDAAFAAAFRYDGHLMTFTAHHNMTSSEVEMLRGRYPRRPARDAATGRAVLDARIIHIPDIREDSEHGLSASQQALGFRTVLAVPMLRDGEPIGALGLWRRDVRPFTDKQIAVISTFASQAVIAIENVRLFKELQERTQELTRSVDELRALGEVGQAVSGSLDIQSVLTSIVSHAVELSKTDAGTIYEFDESTQAFVPQANYGMSEELIEALRQSHIRVGEGAVGQAARTRAAFQIADLEREPHYALRFLIEAGYRALLAVPLLREDRVIGGLVVRRKAAGTFPKPIVDLLQTFATQSVIAIQNARLFREIDEKSRALEELSRNQEQLSRLSTALQEPLSLSEQLTRVLDAARQVVGLDHLYIWTPSPAADGFMVSAGAGLSDSDWRDLVGVTIPVGEAGALAAVYRDGEPLLFSEAHPLPEKYRLRPPYSGIAALRLKAFLVSPMIARGRTVGVLSADNRVSRAPIPAHTVDLLHSFAAQAAVAVENARLFQEIQEKSQQLELASKHKSQFLANMSHELRTPMNAVLGYTDLILDDIFGDVPAPIRETLERVKTNGHHLLALINDVLDLSRMEAGQLTLSLADYAMGEVVHAVVSAVESLAAGKKLAFKAIVPADLPPGRGDERRLTQVLLNLAGNAIKFTDAGEVSIEARAVDGAFLVSVSDTGPGIAEADQQKIFEEFQQADSSSTRTKGGSGLGLSISRRIVELHGGRLWAESVLGKGSTFYFTVPLRVERPAERA